MTNKKDAERLAQLEAEVAALKASLAPKPAPEPFKPAPYQRYDPTAGMSMPPSALAAMVNAEPRGFMSGVVADNRGPTGPSSAVPDNQQQSAGPRPSAGDGTGWSREIPLGPSPHQRYVDQQIDAQDRRDQQARIQQAASAETARRLAEQGEKLNQLMEQVVEQNKENAEPGK